jgi:hypothetical protein
MGGLTPFVGILDNQKLKALIFRVFLFFYPGLYRCPKGETRQIVFLEAAISLKVEDFPNLGGG